MKGANNSDKLFDKNHRSGSSAASGGGLGLGSILGFTAKMVLPGFADGTDSMVPGIPAIVGEKGPELFVPPSAGAIVPNSRLKDGLGNGHVFNIDARGATDPAQTVAIIDNYMKTAAPKWIATSVKAVHEISAHVAPSARR